MSTGIRSARIISIVAGHGEVTSVPILLQRIADDVAPGVVLEWFTPIRTTQYGFVQNPGERERCFDQARGRAGLGGGILVLLDSEGEAPCQLGPALLQRVRTLAGGRPVEVVLAHQEFEAWFLAAAASLAGTHGLPAGLVAPSDPERIRNAKGWLSEQMPTGQVYRPRRDQAGFTATIALDQARRCGSFEKCSQKIERLIRAVCHG